MFVAGHTAAQQPQLDLPVVMDLMNCTGRDGDGITFDDVSVLTSDGHPAGAGQNIVNFFGLGMIVGLGGQAGCDASFG